MKHVARVLSSAFSFALGLLCEAQNRANVQKKKGGPFKGSLSLTSEAFQIDLEKRIKFGRTFAGWPNAWTEARS